MGFLAPLPVHAAQTPADPAIGAASRPKLQSIRRIVFLGDSITQAGDYVTDVQCWLCAQRANVEVLNLGLGSETATDLTPQENASHLEKFGFGRPFLSERLDRVLEAAKPDLLFACYGMNDGSNLPSDASGDRRFANAITRLRESALRSGVKRVVICTPPVHDARQHPGLQPHDESLTRYTSWLLSRRASGWDVVDIHTPMRRSLDEGRSSDPSFMYAQDGVHPDRRGHWIMAREILKQFFGADLKGATRAEELFPVHGPEIRKLISKRSKLLFDAWMTELTHTRPGVPGGPGAKPGALTVCQAQARAVEITAEIVRLRCNTNSPSALSNEHAIPAGKLEGSETLTHKNEI
ncbi:MAG TPA: SGNH/GDSL hydrolase family protein [Candidatus Paceibacterota bacterium]|nr:SGNH/GDSL hydrolase family protein [Verrucomicrobiota bacterium]HSA12841.1 SGNH/GDSL hydrolase family protein [Candidatus Paceibacterota bacterium]